VEGAVARWQQERRGRAGVARMDLLSPADSIGKRRKRILGNVLGRDRKSPGVSVGLRVGWGKEGKNPEKKGWGQMYLRGMCVAFTSSSIDLLPSHRETVEARRSLWKLYQELCGCLGSSPCGGCLAASSSPVTADSPTWSCRRARACVGASPACGVGENKKKKGGNVRAPRVRVRAKFVMPHTLVLSTDFLSYPEFPFRQNLQRRR